MPTRYWIGTGPQDNVRLGQAGGFGQCGHGKGEPLRKMKDGDIFIYYSPKTSMNDGEPLQSFTAIGRITGDDAYQAEMGPDFKPWRQNVEWLSSTDAPIRPLLDQLSFTIGRASWGFMFRRGHFEISETDARLIATAMGVALTSSNL